MAAMTGWQWVGIWWLCFAITHTLFSVTAIRRAFINLVGKNIFLILYSLLALVIFVFLVSAYWPARHSGPLLWDLRTLPGLDVLAMVLSAIAWAIIIAGYLQPSPVSLVPGKHRGPEGEVQSYGLIRVTRHPLFMGIALWGVAHLLLHGFLSDVMFFGGFVAYALLGSLIQDNRKRSTKPHLTEFYATTSWLPFAAIKGGRNHLVLGELPWLGFVMGLVVAALLYAAHSLF